MGYFINRHPTSYTQNSCLIMSRLINDPSPMGVQVVGPRMSELSAVQRKCTVSFPF